MRSWSRRAALVLEGETMARTSGRRWKGCRLCKPHKDARNGDAYRMPVSVARKAYGGRLRRLNRHDLPADH
jgi:hypothetical protein